MGGRCDPILGSYNDYYNIDAITHNYTRNTMYGIYTLDYTSHQIDSRASPDYNTCMVCLQITGTRTHACFYDFSLFIMAGNGLIVTKA